MKTYPPKPTWIVKIPIDSSFGEWCKDNITYGLHVDETKQELIPRMRKYLEFDCEYSMEDSKLFGCQLIHD